MNELNKTKRNAGGASDVFSQHVSQAFGAILQSVRREQGMKQDVFADELGVSRTTVSNIECGRQRVFLDQVFRAAAILKVPVTQLLPRQDKFDFVKPVHSAIDDPLSGAAITEIADLARELSSADRSSDSSPTLG